MDETPEPRRSWFGSIPWWLWAVIAVSQSLLIPGRIDDFSSAGARHERTEAAMMAVAALVMCLFASAFAVRAWRSRQL